jgi:hypothetical protein
VSNRKPRRSKVSRSQPVTRALVRPSPLILIMLFLIGAAWRLLYLARLSKSPLAWTMFDDARIYWAWSGRIAEGKLIGDSPFFLAPLYPYVVGVLRSVGIAEPSAILSVQALWGAAAAVLLADAARRLTTPFIGVTIGVIVSLYEMAVFFDALFLTESLLFFVSALLLWLVMRVDWQTGRWSAAVGLGLLIGLLSSGRATATLLLVPAALLVRRRPRNLAALAGAFLVTLLPSLLHNFVTAREWIPFTYNSGLNLYIGNNPKATGTYVPIIGTGGQPQGLDAGMELDGRDYLRKSTGRSFSPAASSSYWTERAIEFVREQPGRALQLAFTKLAMLWNSREYPQIENVEEYRQFAAPIGIPLVGTFFFLGALALAGTVFSWSAGDRGRFLLGYVTMLSLGTIPFFVTDRYRHALIPACALLAALALQVVWSAWRRGYGRWRAMTPVLVGLAIVHLPTPGPTIEQRTANLAKNTGARLFLAGWTAAQAGQWDKAEAAFSQAVDADPRLYGAWSALIQVQVQGGRIPAAQETFAKARAAGLPEAATHVYSALFAALRGDRATAESELEQVPATALDDPSLAEVVRVTQGILMGAR